MRIEAKKRRALVLELQFKYVKYVLAGGLLSELESRSDSESE